MRSTLTRLHQSVLLTASSMDGVGCVITKTGNTILAANFIYSMCFDFIVLCLNAYISPWTSAPHHGIGLAGSRITKIIFEDGLIYFIIA